MIAAEASVPQCLAAGLGHGITNAFASQLLGHPRLARRSAEILASRLDKIVPTSTQAVALALDASGLADLVMRAGVVWHASYIARLIDGTAIRELVAAIGAEFRLLAIRHLDIAPSLSESIATTTLAERIAPAGHQCLAAWCMLQPGPIWYRVAPRAVIGDATLLPLLRAHGPRIVDTLLMSMKEDMP